LKKNKKILIIIQRANGDVLLSHSLIDSLSNHYQGSIIDLLVNDDTLPLARLLPKVNSILTFSYKKKKDERWMQEKKIIQKIYRKYDLSINLTASDRSVIYSLLSSKKSISAIEKKSQKSWWKKILLTHYYFFDIDQHILVNNLKALNLLNINKVVNNDFPKVSEEITNKVKLLLEREKISQFIIFHPSSQYDFKIYPKHLRDELLEKLNSLEIPIIISGSNNKVDLEIKKDLPKLKNLYDFIGKLTLEEYFALSQLSISYIGMDTLNMHIASVQNKQIFAIFGPTNLSMWSPWSNDQNTAAKENIPLQKYGKVTIFQSSMPCVACGKAGCNDNNGRSECLFTIKPEDIFSEIKKSYTDA
jgi:heptosyltransferase III